MKKFKFRPRKDIDRNGNTNEVRAIRARDSLDIYTTQVCNSEDQKLTRSTLDESTVQDLVTDLLHLCDRYEIEDPEHVLKMAVSNWKEER